MARNLLRSSNVVGGHGVLARDCLKGGPPNGRTLLETSENRRKHGVPATNDRLVVRMSNYRRDRGEVPRRESPGGGKGIESFLGLSLKGCETRRRLDRCSGRDGGEAAMHTQTPAPAALEVARSQCNRALSRRRRKHHGTGPPGSAALTQSSPTELQNSPVRIWSFHWTKSGCSESLRMRARPSWPGAMIRTSSAEN